MLLVLVSEMLVEANNGNKMHCLKRGFFFYPAHQSE